LGVAAFCCGKDTGVVTSKAVAVDAPEPRDLAENGREVYGWRMIMGEPELVVIAIGFTIAGLQREAFEDFKQRMFDLSEALGQLGYAVDALTFQRRRAREARHWAEFVCATPETALPEAPRVAGR